MTYVWKGKIDIAQILQRWQKLPYHDDIIESCFLRKFKYRCSKLVLRLGTTLEY